MNKYLKSTNLLLKQCESESGYVCDVTYDQSLPVYSTVQIAGGGNRKRHRIILKQYDNESSYYIAWQAVFILRHFQVDESQRANLALNKTILPHVKNEVTALYSDFPDTQISAISKQIVDGLLTQLRSVPIGILVDMYLYKNFPELRDIQESSLTKQVHDFWASLNIDKTKFPESIVIANQQMNAAHASMVDYQYPSPELTAPYDAVGMGEVAMKLVGCCLDANLNAINDKQLIDQWAAILNIKDWYEWV